MGSEEMEQFWGMDCFEKWVCFYSYRLRLGKVYTVGIRGGEYSSGEKIGWDRVTRIVGTLKID